MMRSAGKYQLVTLCRVGRVAPSPGLPFMSALVRTSARLKNFLKTALVLLSCITLPSCVACAEEIKLRVGVISGLTGAAAKWCAFQNMGMKLAQEELTSEGVNVDLIFEDSQTLAPKVISAYHKLAELDKVDVILSDDFGFVVAPLLPLVEKQRRLLVSIGLPQDNYCKTAPTYFFSSASQIPQTRAAFERFFDLNPQVKRIGLVVFDDPEWGNSYLAIWRDIAQSRGITIVDTFLNNEWQPDFKTALTRMLPKNPDAILFAHEPEGMIKALKQMSFSKPVVAANNILEMLADKEAARPELEGVYFVDPNISEDFRQKFRKRFEREPILEAYTGYESVRVVAKAAVINRSDVAAAMKKVRYQGVAGTIDFTTGSCAGNNASWDLYRFVGGVRVKQ